MGGWETILENIWFITIVGGVIACALFAFLLIIFGPLQRALYNLGHWLKLMIFNPFIEAEIALTGEIAEMDKETFLSLINEILFETTGKQAIVMDDMMKTNKKIDDCSVDILISPISTSTDGDFYDHFLISIKLHSLRVRNINSGLIGVQNFLFKDIITAIHRNIPSFNPIIENESITVKFEKKPRMLNAIKDLNVNVIQSNENGVDILLTEDKLKFTGSFSNATFLKFEGLLKQNLPS